MEALITAASFFNKRKIIIIIYCILPQQIYYLQHNCKQQYKMWKQLSKNQQRKASAHNTPKRSKQYSKFHGVKSRQRTNNQVDSLDQLQAQSCQIYAKSKRSQINNIKLFKSVKSINNHNAIKLQLPITLNNEIFSSIIQKGKEKQAKQLKVDYTVEKILIRQKLSNISQQIKSIKSDCNILSEALKRQINSFSQSFMEISAKIGAKLADGKQMLTNRGIFQRLNQYRSNKEKYNRAQQQILKRYNFSIKQLI